MEQAGVAEAEAAGVPSAQWMAGAVGEAEASAALIGHFAVCAGGEAEAEASPAAPVILAGVAEAEALTEAEALAEAGGAGDVQAVSGSHWMTSRLGVAEAEHVAEADRIGAIAVVAEAEAVGRLVGRLVMAQIAEAEASAAVLSMVSRVSVPFCAGSLSVHLACTVSDLSFGQSPPAGNYTFFYDGTGYWRCEQSLPYGSGGLTSEWWLTSTGPGTGQMTWGDGLGKTAAGPVTCGSQISGVIQMPSPIAYPNATLQMSWWEI
jgi:hypothetical protein